MNVKNLSFEDINYKEWLYTNGAGAYASTTISGMNSRRYHGLLVASSNPPIQRQVLVSSVQESVWYQDKLIDLSTNQYPGVIHPDGYNRLVEFNREPFPEMIFKTCGYTISKAIFMVYGRNTTVVSYKNNSSEVINIKARPLFVGRDFHSLFKEDSYYDFYYETENGIHRLYPHYNAKPIYFKDSSESIFFEERDWYKNAEYFKEILRGQDFAEDRYSLGYFNLEIQPDEEVYLIFSTEKEILKSDPVDLKAAELERVDNLNPKTENKFYNDLVINSEQFIVKRASTKSFSIIAGYHWFADWGRDTMISLMGLIDTGKKKEAKSILTTFIKYLNEGMLPNRFPDYEGEAPEYNTIDATLWLFVALYHYFETFGDKSFIKANTPKLMKVIEFHLKGTRYGIRADEQTGLLRSTDRTVQLTWMDAKVGDYVVTPRTGYAVEINCLWFNAFKIMSYFMDENEQKVPTEITEVIQKVESNFVSFFWNENGYLNDYIDLEEKPDTSIRPNQIYAVSLPFGLLNTNQEKQIVQLIEEYLLTDFGLRSLATGHPDFKNNYTGNQWFRDTAYHQGTVWAFLIGEYLLSYLKVNKFTKKAKGEVIDFLEPMKEHFYNENCIYGISEIFDGHDPDVRRGKGCVNQAWSVFNLIRVIKVCQ